MKKRKMVMIPFSTASLSPAISTMLNENITTEITKTRVFDVRNRYPGFNLDAVLGMPYETLDLYKLSEVSDVQFLLIPSIEKTENGAFKISANLYDVRRINLVQSYYRECACPFEDVVFLILPDLANAISKGNFNLATKCPSGMEKIGKATFSMGSTSKYDNNPQVTARVSNFCIDKLEFPNKMGQNPIVNKNWTEAHNLCTKTGKRLCTEFEWEYACRGKFNFIYPYGNAFQKNKCHTDGKKAAKAGAHLGCKGEHPLYDMSGNVLEWTGNSWDANIQNKVIRGGGWFAGEKDSKCTVRVSNRPSTRAKTIGFRCCKSVR